jgi:hypothetical protein
MPQSYYHVEKQKDPLRILENPEGSQCTTHGWRIDASHFDCAGGARPAQKQHHWFLMVACELITTNEFALL